MSDSSPLRALKYSQRLLAVGSAALAAAAVGSASAAVTITEVKSGVTTLEFNFDPLGDNLNFGGGYLIGGFRFCNTNLMSSGPTFAWAIAPLALGEVVDGNLSYDDEYVSLYIPYGETVNLGYRVQNSEVRYGYLQITAPGDFFSDRRYAVNFYSFETTSGLGITVIDPSAIPEPGAVGLGVVGLASGLLLRRRS